MCLVEGDEETGENRMRASTVSLIFHRQYNSPESGNRHWANFSKHCRVCTKSVGIISYVHDRICRILNSNVRIV